MKKDEKETMVAEMREVSEKMIERKETTKMRMMDDLMEVEKDGIHLL